jgi:hypothetical protein
MDITQMKERFVGEDNVTTLMLMKDLFCSHENLFPTSARMREICLKMRSLSLAQFMGITWTLTKSESNPSLFLLVSKSLGKR